MSRTYHSKSRNGCSQCKRRRVKCNMMFPRCNHCRRRQEPCDLQWRMADDDQKMPLVSSPVRVQQLPVRGTMMSNDKMNDIALLGHFANFTGPSISLVQPAVVFWAKYVPEDAERMPFLHHGLVAISTMHMAERPPPSSPEDGSGYKTSLLPTAYRHWTEALSLFRSTVRSIDADNCVAVFSFILIVIILQFKTVVHDDDDNVNDDKSSVAPIQVINAIRGGFELFRSIAPLVAHSPIAPLFMPHTNRTVVHHSETRDAAAALDALITEIISDEDEEEEEGPDSVTEYVRAIEELQSWILTTHSRPKGWAELTWWPTTITTGYISRLHRGQPYALLIYLHWCVALQERFHEWFLRGHAAYMLSRTRAALGGARSHLVEYPSARLFKLQ